MHPLILPSTTQPVTGKKKGYQFRLVNIKPSSGQTYLRTEGKNFTFDQVMWSHAFTTCLNVKFYPLFLTTAGLVTSNSLRYWSQYQGIHIDLLIPVAEQFKARLAGIAGSNLAGGMMSVLYSKEVKAKRGQSRQRDRKNPAGGMDVYLVSVVCCQIEGSATGRSLVQRSPTDCSVSLCVI
jgi:hypothetical protein